ncbi:MAG: phosphatidate cytidylyltransferase [Succinivibrio sp.]|nr:phosphatidate cytidylyltransferase [Succinivibrio sp.]
MRTRIITAVVLLSAAMCWLFVADYAFFTMGALLIYMVGAWEMGPLLGFKSKIPFLILATAAACALFIVAPPGEFVSGGGIPSFVYAIIASGMLVWLGCIPLVLQYPRWLGWHENRILTALMGLLMLVPFLESLLVLRSFLYHREFYRGALVVLSVMALVWCADSGAYFCGRFLGRTPMLPAVSPKKTLEGLLGGLVAGVLGLYIFTKLQWYGNYAENTQVLMFSGILAIIFSVEGDLVESMLKRLAGIKDSGKIFPGHGGMLDRIDSQLAALPTFISSYCLLNWILH